jgi:pimeloyl-ACP methyl ester carboxylesterase
VELNVRRFGMPQREAVGLLQSPQRGAPHRAAFLMCRPFGQEAVRTAPIYRALSDRLARAGCTVLTFDMHGCGDSPGELAEQSLASWADDVLAADRQLRIDAPGVPIHWFGMGLGASIAAGAALGVDPAPNCLVIWEPVLDGSAYLQRLLSMHRAELAREMQRDWVELVTRGGESEPVLPGSVLGFTVGKRLHEELLVLRNLPLAAVCRRGTRLVVALQQQERLALDVSDIAGVALHTVETPTNWMSIEARGTAIVPQELTRIVLATL